MPSSVSSSAAPIVEIELLSGGQSISLTPHNHFQSLQLTERALGSFHGFITLFDPEYEVLEDIFLQAGGDRFMRIRWSWDELGLNAANVPTITGFIVKYTPVFEPHGVVLTAEILSGNLKDSMLDRRTRSFPAQTLISAMVQSIADERRWTAFIEPTTQQWPEPINSHGESDPKFIARTLRQKALNAAGEGGYMCYFDCEDRFHFHTPGFPADGSVRVKEYVVARDNSGEVVSFEPTDASFFAATLGAGKTLFRASSSVDGAATAKEGDPEVGVADAGVRLDPTAEAVPDYGDGVMSVHDFHARHDVELVTAAQARYDDMRKFVYPARLTVLGTHDVRTLDFVDVQYIKADGQPHYLSGQFRVMEVIHQVDMSGWKTILDLARSGRGPASGTVSRSGKGSLTPSPI